MAQIAGCIEADLDAQKLVSNLRLTLKVRGKRRALWKVKIAASIVVLASMVLGGRVDLEAEVG